MISVILFDLDDTLFAHRRAVDRGVAAHLTATGLAPIGGEAAEVARWTELEEQHYERYLTGELEYLDQRRARARDFMAPYGVEFVTDSQAEGWFENYLVEYRRAWTLHHDALPLLHTLRRGGYRLGIITNGDLQFQMAKLDAMQLNGHFEHVVTSGEFGIVKPDARIFQHAASLFGVAPSQAMYIGDRLRTDALGAAAAGLTGVWLDRDSLATSEQLAQATAADVPVIRTLADLPALLAD